MLIKYGGGIVDARGSVAGNTFSRNRYGAYIRARVTPVNPQSERQTNARAIVASLAEQWRESPMTAADRIAWGVYAASINAVNKLGEDITLTGFNAFMMGNPVALHHSLGFVQAGPTTLGLPAQDPTVSIALSEASGITVTFDDTMEVYDEDDAGLSIEIGQPQSPSRNFFGGPFRLHGIIAGDSVTPPTSPDGPTAVTAWSLIEGQKVWCRFRVLRADGRVSNAWMAAPVLVAA